MTSRRALQITLAALGAIATAAGARGVLRGVAEVSDSVDPAVDSEYRFYAMWYHLAGLVLLNSAREPATAATVVRTISAGLLGAACARTLSLRTVGPPRPSQRFLRAAEFVIPVIIVPWQARVARTMGDFGYERPRRRCLLT